MMLPSTARAVLFGKGRAPTSSDTAASTTSAGASDRIHYRDVDKDEVGLWSNPTDPRRRHHRHPYRDDPREVAAQEEDDDDDQISTTSTWMTAHSSAVGPTKMDRARDNNNNNNGTSERPHEGSWAHFFFGFMYEETDDSTDDGDTLEQELYSSAVDSYASLWNRTNLILAASLTLSALANAVPVALVASIGRDLGGGTSTFAPRAAAAAVLGTSLGKLFTGPVVDVWGARKTWALHNFLLALCLLALAMSTSEGAAAAACFGVEFCTSVQWPSCLVVLATHWRGHPHGQYEGGVYLTSLALRLGALLGIPVCTTLLRQNLSWRAVAGLGAWVALLALSVTYLYVHDAPGVLDEPQNPVDPQLLQKWFPTVAARDRYHSQHPNYISTHPLPPRPTPGVYLRLAALVIRTNVVPSLRHILFSGTFWIVAFAHAGSAVVRTSERVLGTYLVETSIGTLSEARASGLAAALGFGTAAGLVVAGGLFARRSERERKWLVSRLYGTSVAACYALALLAIPAIRRTVLPTPTVVTALQTGAVFAAGFGIAVPFYHIPSLVGATFGCDKGLYSSYTDAVAYAIAFAVWRIIGRAVQHPKVDDSGGGGGADAFGDGGGWAYGWAAVALLLIPSALLMVEFMEHYFCRHRCGGTLETILIA